ncbi:F-actin-capping protein subunit alpha, partial [Peltigera leucophlebia]|nr:F-actin-capping protein subunit alpha [Peltigera leucophlebia]
MASANAIAVSAFIQGAPPGELGDVISDIKSLTGPDSASLLKTAEPAFRNYAEAQLLTAKLPSSSPGGQKT